MEIVKIYNRDCDGFYLFILLKVISMDRDNNFTFTFFNATDRDNKKKYSNFSKKRLECEINNVNIITQIIK